MKSSVGVSARGPPRDPGSREAFGEHRKDSEGAGNSTTAPNGKEEAELGQTPQAVGLAGPQGTRAI